jgi:EAL domain-containing protein (putative c-di-GMP-specific phosphodiesterase class I)
MGSLSKGVSIQPVMNRTRGLWYYEWFAGVAETDWLDTAAAGRADDTMLGSLQANARSVMMMPIGVNLSFLTAVHGGLAFVSSLSELLPQGSIVEITEHAVETASVQDLERLKETCHAIREAGMILALDDCTANHPFGDPYIWRLLGARIIKLDLSNGDSLPVAPLAKAEGLCVVCERIETPAMETQAVTLGADGFQGFLMGSPLPFSQATREVRRHV